MSTNEEPQTEQTKEKKEDISYGLFSHQVSGHFPILHHNGLLYKPAFDAELEFYQNIDKWLPSIVPFIPCYRGIKSIKDIDIINNEKEEKNNNTINYSQHCFIRNKHRMQDKYLILENLTYFYKFPCILDLKIGIRNFSPICNDDKKKEKLKKSWCSTNRSLGIRIGGMKIYNHKNKEYQFIDKYTAIQYNISH